MVLTAICLGLIAVGMNSLAFLLRGFKRAPKTILYFPNDELFEPIPPEDEELHDMQLWAHLASQQPTTITHLESCYGKPYHDKKRP